MEKVTICRGTQNSPPSNLGVLELFIVGVSTNFLFYIPYLTLFKILTISLNFRCNSSPIKLFISFFLEQNVA